MNKLQLNTFLNSLLVYKRSSEIPEINSENFYTMDFFMEKVIGLPTQYLSDSFIADLRNLGKIDMVESKIKGSSIRSLLLEHGQINRKIENSDLENILIQSNSIKNNLEVDSIQKNLNVNTQLNELPEDLSKIDFEKVYDFGDISSKTELSVAGFYAKVKGYYKKFDGEVQKSKHGYISVSGRLVESLLKPHIKVKKNTPVENVSPINSLDFSGQTSISENDGYEDNVSYSIKDIRERSELNYQGILKRLKKLESEDASKVQKNGNRYISVKGSIVSKLLEKDSWVVDNSLPLESSPQFPKLPQNLAELLQENFYDISSIRERSDLAYQSIYSRVKEIEEKFPEKVQKKGNRVIGIEGSLIQDLIYRKNRNLLDSSNINEEVTHIDLPENLDEINPNEEYSIISIRNQTELKELTLYRRLLSLESQDQSQVKRRGNRIVSVNGKLVDKLLKKDSWERKSTLKSKRVDLYTQVPEDLSKINLEIDYSVVNIREKSEYSYQTIYSKLKQIEKEFPEKVIKKGSSIISVKGEFLHNLLGLKKKNLVTSNRGNLDEETPKQKLENKLREYLVFDSYESMPIISKDKEYHIEDLSEKVLGINYSTNKVFINNLIKTSIIMVEDKNNLNISGLSIQKILGEYAQIDKKIGRGEIETNQEILDFTSLYQLEDEVSSLIDINKAIKDLNLEVRRIDNLPHISNSKINDLRNYLAENSVEVIE